MVVFWRWSGLWASFFPSTELAGALIWGALQEKGGEGTPPGVLHRTLAPSYLLAIKGYCLAAGRDLASGGSMQEKSCSVM